MKLSLGRKIVILVIIIALILSGTCICVSGVVIRNMMNDEYVITADAMATTVATMVDGDAAGRITEKVMAIYNNSEVKLDNTQTDDPRFEEYAAQYYDLMDDEDYLSVQECLRRIQDNGEADCVYILMMDPEEQTAIYIVDAACEDDLVTPGCFDIVEESCVPYLSTPEVGFPAFISKTPEYGWMITSCFPIHNSEGDIACYAAVDLDMNEINNTQNRFLLMLTGILLLLTFLICIFSILYVNLRFVKPINMLTEAAGQYGQNHVTAGCHNEFSTLQIRTGDELEILLRSMVKMEQDIDNYIDSLTQTKEQLTNARQQANDMQQQAHRDSMTGIRNRTAYDKEIVQLEGEVRSGLHSFGIAVVDLNYLKTINDTYGHEYGNSSIISLSRLICDVFAHSPVFRIGGDEFALILKNHDYMHIDELCEAFNSQIDLRSTDVTLQPWERISAAFGYALFNPDTDTCVEDVFNRADKNMYERKKAMKAARKS